MPLCKLKSHNGSHTKVELKSNFYYTIEIEFIKEKSISQSSKDREKDFFYEDN